MYTALDIAKWVISFCYNKEQPISNLQLQKILYFLWVDYFNRTDEHLFEDEIFAW